MKRTLLEKRIDDLLASGVTLRFTGSVFENAATPGAGQVFKMQDVLRRVRAGRAWALSETSENGTNELLVRSMPRRTFADAA